MARSGRPFVILAIVGVAGLLVLIAADRFARPELIGPGLLLFALGTLAAGGHAIVMRYSYEGSRASHATWVFEGSAAVLIGVVLVILGLAFGVAGVAFVLGAEHKLVDHLLARPGLVLVALGTASCAGGGARLLGAREWRGSLRRFLATLPERIGGVFLLLLGLAALAAGVFEVVAPAAFDGALDALLAPFRGEAR